MPLKLRPELPGEPLSPKGVHWDHEPERKLLICNGSISRFMDSSWGPTGRNEEARREYYSRRPFKKAAR